MNDPREVRLAMLRATAPLVTDDETGFGVTAEACALLLRDLALTGERHHPGTMAALRGAMLEVLQLDPIPEPVGEA